MNSNERKIVEETPPDMFDYLRDELIRLDWRSAVETYIKSPRSLRFVNQTGATIYADSFQMLTY